MTNVLITGIDGFVGSHLAEALLLDPDNHVTGLVRDHSSLRNIEHLVPRLQLLQAEITDHARLLTLIKASRPDKVFHLAGQAFVPKAFDNPVETFEVNIMGTLNVLEAVRRYLAEDGKGSRCSALMVSSGEVYGRVEPSNLPIDESLPVAPSNLYASSKASADMIARMYRSSFGMDVVIARPFNHLGPRQSDQFVGSSLARQLAEISAGKRKATLSVGSLSPERDFTDVRDVVRAYILLLEQKQEFETFNVCSGKSISVRSIIDILCKASGLAVDITSDPSRIRPNEIPRVVGSYGRLRGSTGWTPTIPLEKTLTDLYAYWVDRITRDP